MVPVKAWEGTSGNELWFQIPGMRLLKSQVRDGLSSKGDAEKKGVETVTESGCKTSLSDRHWAKAGDTAKSRLSGGSPICTGYY